MQPEITQPGAVAVPAIGESNWATLDRIGSYVFAAIVLGGGMIAPLALAAYSLFFRN